MGSFRGNLYVAKAEEEDFDYTGKCQFRCQLLETLVLEQGGAFVGAV